MKKLLALLLVSIMSLGTVGCSAEKEAEEPTTVGGILLEDFMSDTHATAQEIADRVITNEIIPFGGATMPVEPGFLMGFDNAEITGFEEGVMFAPMMGTIPFVGYVFDLEDGTDADAFVQTLKDSANLRWNICTEADELTVDSEGDKVFFLMSPLSFEEE